jgi:hypothetical protein
MSRNHRTRLRVRERFAQLDWERERASAEERRETATAQLTSSQVVVLFAVRRTITR